MPTRAAPSIRLLSGWLALSVLATLVFGTLALWLTDRANDRHLQDFHRLLRAVDATRLAQVHFKTQVQEWKNVLLRGQDAADYERYLEQFRLQGSQTIERLEQASLLQAELGLDTADATVALREHAALMRLYDEALRGYQRGDVASVFAVDAGIRGQDRQLNETIDGIADAMERDADRRMGVFAEEDRRRYRLLRGVFVALSACTFVLGGWLVALTLRRRDTQDSA